MKKTLKGLVIVALIAGGMSNGRTQAEEGLYGSADMLFLTPKLNDSQIHNMLFDGVGGVANVLTHTGGVESNMDFAQRVTVGYEGDDGGGVQVRWFTFDNTIEYNGAVTQTAGGNPALVGNLNLDIDAVDAELVQRGNFQVWDWLATAGVRYSKLSLRNENTDFTLLNDELFVQAPGVQFEGAGPTVSVGGEREVIWEGFSIFARGRTSLLYGELDHQSIYSATVSTDEDELVQVTEVQLGTEFEVEFDSFDLITGIFWEAQRWDSGTGLLGGLGLHGFGARFGIEY